MRILLSSIGSRGDVQPILALAVELQAIGHDARLCVAPNFGEWIRSFGVDFVPIGPDLKAWTAVPAPARPRKLSPAQRQQLADGMVRGQFQVLPDAARDCDLIVGAGVLQIATRSVAEALGVPYVFVAYSPDALPSPDHPPARIDARYPRWLPRLMNRILWRRDARSFDLRFGAALNEGRAKLGLPPVGHVKPHVFTDTPWLAADPVLAPPSPRRGTTMTQPGAWLLHDSAPLPDALERFLGDGEPPVYFGFGSMRRTGLTGADFIAAARALGLRTIVSRGWAGLAPLDDSPDCIAIDEVDHAKLLPRVAAVVHHGGAGTTTAAARAGRPQVIVPHNYDQHYWASRVKELGIGTSASSPERLTTRALASALRASLTAATITRARALAPRITTDAARRSAERLVGSSAAQPIT